MHTPGCGGPQPTSELIGVLRAWRRQSPGPKPGSWPRSPSWPAAARPTAPARRAGEFPAELSEFLPDEVAMALTLTQRAGETQVGLALDLARRPAIAAALETGRIDLRRRWSSWTHPPLGAAHAAAVRRRSARRAGQTTGELRQR